MSKPPEGFKILSTKKNPDGTMSVRYQAKFFDNGRHQIQTVDDIRLANGRYLNTASSVSYFNHLP